MIEPLQIATLGLAPGWSTFHCASLGHFFDVVIIVSPERGGSNLEVIDLIDSRRLVTVKVYYKNQYWTQSIWIDTIIINNSIKIISSFKSIKSKFITMTTKLINRLKNITINLKSIN